MKYLISAISLIMLAACVLDSPNIKQDRFKWIGQYIKQAEPDYIIQIGDWASFDSLSFFQKNSY